MHAAAFGGAQERPLLIYALEAITGHVALANSRNVVGGGGRGRMAHPWDLPTAIVLRFDLQALSCCKNNSCAQPFFGELR